MQASHALPWHLALAQCGLSGSSAIACAALNCLLRHYGVEGAVPPPQRPQLVLSAEQDLGITAGLQDRVVQVCVAVGWGVPDVNTSAARSG